MPIIGTLNKVMGLNSILIAVMLIFSGHCSESVDRFFPPFTTTAVMSANSAVEQVLLLKDTDDFEDVQRVLLLSLIA